MKVINSYRIWDPHNSGYEEFCFLRYNLCSPSEFHGLATWFRFRFLLGLFSDREK
jgi:hypothetical protein